MNNFQNILYVILHQTPDLEIECRKVGSRKVLNYGSVQVVWFEVTPWISITNNDLFDQFPPPHEYVSTIEILN